MTAAADPTLPLFYAFAAFVFGVEGPPSIDPRDAGGFTTWYGIIQDDVDTYAAAHGLGHMDVHDITQEQAKQILYELYWRQGRDGEPAPYTITDPSLALVLADTGLNPVKGIWPRVRNILGLTGLSDREKALYLINARSEEYTKHGVVWAQAGLQNRLKQLRQAIAGFHPAVVQRH